MYLDITINNRVLKVRSTASVLQACEEAGYTIPRFCYHEQLSVAGNCRMCLVEIQKSPKPVVSCAMPISKGMVIFTETPLVKKAREAVLEFLLINHPLDCPICDQGGECDLQDETIQFGSDRGRYFEFKRAVEDKECGPIIKTIMTRCIHCTRCIRFSSEVAGQAVLGSFGRGQDTEIGTYIQNFIKTELSGNLVDLCPVGALTSKPYAYSARSWELQQVQTIDFFDSMCSDIIVHSRTLSNTTQTKTSPVVNTGDTILRIVPKFGGLYEENWISDRTRYAFDGLKNQQMRVNNIQWAEILTTLQKRFETSAFKASKKENFINKNNNIALPSSRATILVGPLCDLQGIYLLNQFIKLAGQCDIQSGNAIPKSNYDHTFFFSFNRSIESLKELESLILVGLNTRFEASLLNTLLRKQQLQRALTYISVGAYSALQLNQNHNGSSLRTLIAMTENRIKTVSNCYISKNTSIFYGFESIRIKNGFLLQNILHFLGKKFYSKTKQGERLGVVHSNVSTLNIAQLGICSGVRSPLHSDCQEDKRIATLFAVQMHDFKTKKWLSLVENTHTVSLITNKLSLNKNFSFDTTIPIQSLYEKNGFLYNIEGRLRKLNKAITSVKTRSLESFFAALSILTTSKQTALWESVWNFNADLSIEAQHDKIMPCFTFNPFLFNLGGDEVKGALFPFAPAITNFYLNDIISLNSPVMGECALFLNSTNLNFDRN